MNRAALRQILRHRRQQLSLDTRHKASISICNRIQALALIYPHQKIAIYIADQSEVNILFLLPYLQNMQAEIYTPLLSPTGRVMSFTNLLSKGYWQTNHLGIQEWISEVTVPAQALDIVFTPMLGFDEYGHRLGQGGGHYDASFAFLHQNKVAKPQLFGVAFECQKVDSILVEKWDVPLQGIITEKSFYCTIR